MVDVFQGSVKDYSMSEIIPVESVAGQQKDNEVVRVLIGFPHEGMTASETYCNRLGNMAYLGKLQERGRLLNEAPRFEFYQKTCGRMHVHVARDEMAKAALAINADYLFMIDDDMIAQDDLFEKLYVEQKDIIAPLAFTRNFPHKPVMYSCIEGWDPVIQKEHFTNYAVMNYPKNKLVQCDAVGFGAVLINMRVIRGLEAPYFMNPNKTGEDISFCYEAKKRGFTIWMDTRLKLGHLSHPIIVTEDYVEQQRKAFGFKQEDFENKYGTYQKYESEEPMLALGE